ncbi:MAG: FAD-dependent oxidoreductase [Nitrospinae bacterium]|nr:FAD-dependent oxidoreductase [Nitrospinota bacterium]
MARNTALGLIESGKMRLEKAVAEEIVVTSGSSWKCPVYVRKLPPCRNECPSSEDIRGYLTTIAQAEMNKKPLDDALDEAWYTLTDKNPLPAAHGRICPHPCEKGCNRKEKEDGAVAINNMERFIGDHGIRRGLKLRKLTDAKKSKRIAVVGSGPSGLSCAYQLARRGYPVTLFEAYDRPGGMLRYGIPPYRLPKDILDAEINNILSLGIELKTKVKIGKDITFEELQKQYDAVYLAIGAHTGANLNVPGEDKGSANVFSAASYLNRVNSGASVDVGNKVIVVGGGDSAVDAARSSLRQAKAALGEAAEEFNTEQAEAMLDSARVSKRAGKNGVESTIIYRRTREEMPAIDSEIEEAEREGIRIEYLTAPVEVLVKDGRAVALKCVKMKLGAPDKSGRRSPVPVEGSEFTMEASSIIVAIGQKPELAGTLAQVADQWGWVKIKGDYSTAVDGVFAGGDAQGLGISTRSVGDGRKAALSIDSYLKAEKWAPNPKGRPVKPENLILNYYPAAPRNEEKGVSIEERGHGFGEIYQTITRDQAVAEANRCMSCGLCFVCDQCRVFCPREAIHRDKKRPQGQVMFTDYTKCNGCHVCFESCPCGYIEMGLGL